MAFSTSRQGGCSRSHWKSLNLGLNCGDDAATVVKNRDLLRERVPAKPLWLRQVHGTQVIRHTGQIVNEPEADAAVTALAGAVCCVLTADCLPVLLCNLRGSRVAVAHAGWKGLAGGVLAALAGEYVDQIVDVTVLPGPLAPAEDLATLIKQAEKVGARVLDFVESSSPYMASADLVICTAGYNTATQVMRYGRRALMIPRVMHRQEQLLRATRLAELGLVHFLHPDRLDPETLGGVISACLANDDEALLRARENGVFNFQGADTFARFCIDLLQESTEATEATHD